MAPHLRQRRRARRRFALAFVSTVSLGGLAAPGCSGPPARTSSPPPPRHDIDAGVAVAPEPDAAPAGPTSDYAMVHDTSLPASNPGGVIHYARNGHCIGMPEFRCPDVPEGQPRPTCNPPPPMNVQCPSTPSEEEMKAAFAATAAALEACGDGDQDVLMVNINSDGTMSNVQFGNRPIDPDVFQQSIDCLEEHLKDHSWPTSERPYYTVEIKDDRSM